MTDDLKLPIKFVLKDSEQFKKDCVEYFLQHQKMTPVRFGYTTDYAESLEYGTGPLSQFQPTVHGGAYTYKTIYEEIYDWAGKKDGKGSGLPIRDEAERRAFAKRVTDRFFMYGMKPHPFWRPAINFLEANAQVLFNKGYSLYEIADEALRVADKCIQDQNLPFNGDLQKTVILERINPAQFKSKDYKDYDADERNRLFKEVGWL